MSIIGVALLAAWNTGNNLYYLVSAVLLSMFFVTLLLGRFNLRGVAIDQVYPETVYQHESFPVRTIVANRKRLLPSFAIETDIHPALVSDQPPFVLCTPPRQWDSVRSAATAPRRGLVKAEQVTVRSRFPVGLFEHGVTRPSAAELLVYPAIRRIHPSILRLLATEGAISTPRRGDSRDFYGIREYRRGDDSRLICWKISAKHGRLMLREFERQEHRGILIQFDGYVNDRSATYEIDLFEKAVSFCASLVWHYLSEGYDVGLLTPSQHVWPGAGRQHFHRLMKVLALIEPLDLSDVGRGERDGEPSRRYGRGRYVPVLVTLDSARPNSVAPRTADTRIVDVRDLEF